MPLHLFDAFGIELEYMIVDRRSLDIRPISDHVLRDEQGRVTSEIEQGPISWSNELTHHVIELKTSAPAADLAPLAGLFHESVLRINQLLAAEQACLLPTAMHPWMDPDREMRLWPHEYHTVYETFNKIFDCRGHGWANLQSMHINLPFHGDEEFARLHAAIRLILPILPALAASSPLLDGKRSGLLDNRLDVYRRNSRRIPSVTGRVIPEPVYSQAGYNDEIFQPMFRDIAPYDPGGVLRNEFLNARGAIARFSRGAIEIRVIDSQECPAADLAIAELTIAVLRLLVAETWTGRSEQQAVPIETLEPVLLAAIQHADSAIVADPAYLRHFGVRKGSLTLRELWAELLQHARQQDRDRFLQHDAALQVLIDQGCLARRILEAIGEGDDRARMHDVYRQLAACLASGEMFRGK